MGKDSSPSKESPGKSSKDSPEKSSPGKDLSPGKDDDSQESGSEGESDDDEDPENIWALEDFSQHIQTEFQEKFKDSDDIFRDHIFPQIKEQVKATTLSVQDMVNNRKNSFEFFGYDFMVDDELKVWLIEVNSSPSMDSHNQPVLQRLVKSVLRDLAKVVIDYPKNKKADTGGF